MNKRHAKPTSAQIASRTYRHVLAIQEAVRELVERQNTLVDRCNKQDVQIDRLIGIQRQFLDRDKMLRNVAEANRFMSFPRNALSGPRK